MKHNTASPDQFEIVQEESFSDRRWNILGRLGVLAVVTGIATIGVCFDNGVTDPAVLAGAFIATESGAAAALAAVVGKQIPIN